MGGAPVPSQVWLQKAIKWAQMRVKDQPPLGRALVVLKSQADWSKKARAALVLAAQDCQSPQLLHDASWKFANACNTFANESRQQAADEDERKWLSLAYPLYEELAHQNTRFAPSRDFASSRLRELGVHNPKTFDPLQLNVQRTPSTAPPPPSVDLPKQPTEPPPETPRLESVERVYAVDAEAGPPRHEPPPEHQMTEEPRHHEPPLQQPEYVVPDEEPDASTGRDNLLFALAKEWRGGDPVIEYFAELVDLMKEELKRSPTVSTKVAPLLSSDQDLLRDLVTECGLPSDAYQVQQRAMAARVLANQSLVLPEHVGRQRWLAAALWNYVLWKMPYGWPTNKYQVEMDLLGYLSSIQIARRFDDSARDLLLASHEFTVQTAAQIPELRQPVIQTWIKTAVGTYLLIGGPEPVQPSETKYSTAVGRLDREEWAPALLSLWRDDANLRSTAAFSLAILAGWRTETVKWMLTSVFDTSRSGWRDSVAFWEAETLKVIGGAKPVRIASNPWQKDAGGGDAVTTASETGGSLSIPSPILKAMVAQLVSGDQAVTVQGNLFKSRRVPTYLLINQFRPFGILKLDFGDRVRREQENYEQYARKRLHPYDCPSECRSGYYKLFVGSNPEPLQGLLTSYVFSDTDRPTTLSEWLRNASSTQADSLVSDLFLKVLRPWVQHVRRQIVDLRMEYPILRPAEADPDFHAFRLHAKTELPRLTTDEVSGALGASLDWTSERLGETFIALTEGVEWMRSRLPDGSDMINPLWLIAELAELGGGRCMDRLYDQAPLSAYNTLTTICHGDLHGENILCASPNQAGVPRPIIVDFETTHEGHICRDFARLEAAILCQVFDWTPEESVALFQWMQNSLGDNTFKVEEVCSGTSRLHAATSAVRRIRLIVSGCGQQLWPIADEEYQVALLACVTPIVRYLSCSKQSRRLAYFLASQVAGSLYPKLVAKED